MERRPETMPWRLQRGAVEPALVGKAALLPHRDRRPAFRRPSGGRWWQGSVAPRRVDRLPGRSAPTKREALTAGKASLHRRAETPVSHRHPPKASAGLVVAAHHHARPQWLATARRPRHQSSRGPPEAPLHPQSPAPEQDCLSASRPCLPGMKHWSAPEHRQQFRPRHPELRSPEQDRLRYETATRQPVRRAPGSEAAHFRPALVEPPPSVMVWLQPARRMMPSAKPAVRSPSGPSGPSRSSARAPAARSGRAPDVFRPALRRAPGGSPATMRPTSARPRRPHGKRRRSGSPRPPVPASRCLRRDGKPAAW